MKNKILEALKEKPMSYQEIGNKFGDAAFEPMKELIEEDKIESREKIWRTK